MPSILEQVKKGPAGVLLLKTRNLWKKIVYQVWTRQRNRYKNWRDRTVATHEAYNNLVQLIQPSTLPTPTKADAPSHYKAQAELHKVMLRIAKESPYSLSDLTRTTSFSRIEDTILSNEATTIPNNSSDKLNISDPFSPNNSETVEYSDVAKQHSDKKSSTGKVEKHIRKFVSHNDHVSKKNHLTTIQISQFDNYLTECLTDPEISPPQKVELSDATLPAPRNSSIHKSDLVGVRGYWEINPNADEFIQESARLPIVNNQIRKIIEHLITSKPKIQGPPELVDIIRKWWEVDIELNTKHERGLDRFIADLAGQMLHYGSGLVVKQRSSSKNGKPYVDPTTERMMSPVWSYAIPDMSTMEVFIDRKGRPRKWRQRSEVFAGDSQIKTYKDADTFLVRLPTQNSSLYFWTPSFVMPALYATTVLKDLYQLIDSHTKDIMHIRMYAQVGNKDYHDGAVTKPMLSTVTSTINRTARGGTPIFPWFVELKKIELDEYIEQLGTAAEFWEMQARRGVGGSSISDGEGDSANRNTADALMESEMKAAASLVPEIQRVFRWLCLDKLWERGIQLESINSHEDMPQLVFEEIDLSQQIRRETHATMLWQSEGLKHSEYRKFIGRDEDGERKDKYYSDIQKEIQEFLTEKQEGEKRKTIQQTRPTNQHGTAPKPKKPKN